MNDLEYENPTKEKKEARLYKKKDKKVHTIKEPLSKEQQRN